MKPVNCQFCKHFLFDADFEGKAVVLCRRCKSKNIVQSLAGSYLVTVSLDKRSERRADKLPLSPRVVIE